MLGHDFNSWGVETRRDSIPPLRRPAERQHRHQCRAAVVCLPWLSRVAGVSRAGARTCPQLMGRGDTQGSDSSSPAARGVRRLCARGLCILLSLSLCRTVTAACLPHPGCEQSGRGESGWCSDMTSTHGAWRHTRRASIPPLRRRADPDGKAPAASVFCSPSPGAVQSRPDACHTQASSRVAGVSRAGART